MESVALVALRDAAQAVGVMHSLLDRPHDALPRRREHKVAVVAFAEVRSFVPDALTDRLHDLFVGRVADIGVTNTGVSHFPDSRFHRCNVFVLRPVASETAENEPSASAASTACR